MRFILQSQVKKIFEGNVKEVVLPCEDGEATVMDFHQPFFYCLRDGFIITREPRNKFAIKSGIARVRGNELTVLMK